MLTKINFYVNYSLHKNLLRITMKEKQRFKAVSLKAILEPYNPWWETTDFRTEVFKRPIFHKIFKDLSSLKQIISITGPRRVGKTTLLKQIIKTLIHNESIDPKQIVYFSSAPRRRIAG